MLITITYLKTELIILKLNIKSPEIVVTLFQGAFKTIKVFVAVELYENKIIWGLYIDVFGSSVLWTRAG